MNGLDHATYPEIRPSHVDRVAIVASVAAVNPESLQSRQILSSSSVSCYFSVIGHFHKET